MYEILTFLKSVKFILNHSVQGKILKLHEQHKEKQSNQQYIWWILSMYLFITCNPKILFFQLHKNICIDIYNAILRHNTLCM